MDVLFHQFHIPGKPGLALTENHLELPLLRRLDHFAKVRSVPVSAGVVLITIDMIDIPASLQRITDQQRFLVLNALRLILMLLLILLAQSGINRTENGCHLPLDTA